MSEVQGAVQEQLTRDVLFDRMMRSYSSSYDLTMVDDDAQPGLAATGHYHVEDTAYMISKKATMWSIESDEYVWFFSLPHLTGADVEAGIRKAYDEGMAMIDLDRKNHMVTRLTAIFLCDGMDDDAAERIRKCRLYKSFQFSLKGWMEFHAVAAEVGKESVVSNGYGRETAKHLKSLLHPQRGGKGRRRWSIFKEMLH